MAATAAALATYITSTARLLSSHQLVELTNFGEDNSSTSINTTELAKSAQQAIYWFQAIATTYDPDNEGWHFVVAAKRTISELYLAAQKFDLHQQYAKMAEDDLAKFMKKRTLSPVTDSTWSPTARTTATPPFDDTFFTPFKAQ
jgi:hypothetical protein